MAASAKGKGHVDNMSFMKPLKHRQRRALRAKHRWRLANTRFFLIYRSSAKSWYWKKFIPKNPSGKWGAVEWPYNTGYVDTKLEEILEEDNLPDGIYFELKTLQDLVDGKYENYKAKGDA